MQNDSDLMAFNTWRAERVGEGTVVFSANHHASKSCSVWWAGPKTDLLDEMRAEARSRGITLIVNAAAYSTPQLKRAVDLIFNAKEPLRKLGFDLQGIAGPTPDFFGLVVTGAPVGDEHADCLPPDVIAATESALSGLLQDCEVRLEDVRIEYGRVFPL